MNNNKSMRKSVYDGILNYISTNHIEPGAKLPNEHELADMLNVSRTSLREGIRMLEGAGFITTKHGDGMYVAEYDGSPLLEFIQYSINYGQGNLWELYDMRKCLEIHYIRESALKITDEQIDHLNEILENMRSLDISDPNELLEYHWFDMDFHLTLYENISNKLAVHIIQLYWDMLLARCLPKRMDNLPNRQVGNHEAIVRALVSRNPDFAQAAMQVHMHDSHTIETA